jgi:NAD(P)-dependent dehydrogenase (short-subunit alcohol dehydrogenase family)
MDTQYVPPPLVDQAIDPRGKTAIVTGAAAGLGHAVAHRLAKAGAHVVVVDIDAESGRRTAEEIGGVFVEGDVGSAACWRQLAQDFEPQLVVFNAGLSGPAEDLAEVTDAGYERMKSVNIDQSVFGLRAVLPVMRRLGGGSVVIVSSVAGVTSLEGVLKPIYFMTKHALTGLTRSVAPLIARDGITLNSFNPGVMDTPMGAAWTNALRAKGRSAEVIAPSRAADVIHDILVGRGTGRCVLLLAGQEPSDVGAPSISGWGS